MCGLKMSKYEMYGLEDIVNEADSIAWDGCHKVYILMDEKQTQQMIDYEYDYLIKAKDSNPYDMSDTVGNWYNHSCYLRFIDVVYTDENGEDEFYPLVAQGENILEVM